MTIKIFNKSQPPRHESKWASIKALMEIKEIYVKKVLLGAITFICLIGFSACKDEVVPPEPPKEKEESNNVDSLEGSAWKLVAFLEVATNTSRPPIYCSFADTNLQYTLSFSESIDGNISIAGVSDWKGMEGNCKINYIDSSIKVDILLYTVKFATYENDESNYYNGIRYATKFEINNKELKIFYNDENNCLVFKKVDVIPAPPEPPPLYVSEPLDSLEGTEWKLVSFVDIENNTSRPPLIYYPLLWLSDDSYTISFNREDTTYNSSEYDSLYISGNMYGNSIGGSYNPDYANSIIKFYNIYQNGMHLIFENDEETYYQALCNNPIFSYREFELNSKELKIFYNDKANKKCCLLFRRLK